MSESETTQTSLLRRILFALKFIEIRLRFVMILVLTALVVGYWDHIQNYYERWQREHGQGEHAGHVEEAASEFEYYCGMHPFVVRDRTGKCPICGMDLVQRKKGAPTTLPEGVLARVQASPERIMQAGVQVEPVLYRLLSRTVRSYGIVEAAESRVADVIARFPGRVEELMVNATGLPIKKGEPLARIYSPEFLQGTLEYQRALENQRLVNENPKADATAHERAERLVASSRKKLSLAGFTDSQLESISKSGGEPETVTLYSPATGTIMKKNVVAGQSVEEGTTIYSIADLSTLWVQVQVIESDISAIHSGMPVEVTSVAWPGEIFYGTVDFFYPEVDASSRSLKVRVAVDNANGKLRPGMYVNAVMRSPMGQYGAADSEQFAAMAKAAEQAKPATDIQFPTQSAEDAHRYLAGLKIGDTYYDCPMHPEVVSDKAGEECPLCHMSLVDHKKGAGATDPGASAESVTTPTETADKAAIFLGSLAEGAEYYTCSMHPEVASDKPGDCPKCNMTLEKATKQASATEQGDEGPHVGSYEQWAEGYTCSMHPEELNKEPGVCTECGCGMKTTKMRVERVLSIPESAVIDTGARKIVYVESASGLYDARAVTLGQRAGAYYAVLDGLVLGQRVAGRGSFLIDAEARLNPMVAGPQAAVESTPSTNEHNHGG